MRKLLLKDTLYHPFATASSRKGEKLFLRDTPPTPSGQALRLPTIPTCRDLYSPFRHRPVKTGGGSVDLGPVGSYLVEPPSKLSDDSGGIGSSVSVFSMLDFMCAGLRVPTIAVSTSG